MLRTIARPARGGHPAAPRRFASGRGRVPLFAVALAAFAAAAGGSSARADSAVIAVRATVLSKNQCKFGTNASTLNFGTLDPAVPVDVTATATIPFVCRGSDPVAAFVVSENGGLNPSGPGRNRMRHATDTAEYLPYSIALSPASGTVPKNAPRTLTITGTILGTDYRGSRAGSFSDTVVVSILP